MITDRRRDIKDVPKVCGPGKCKNDQPFTEKRKTTGQAYLRKNIQSTVLYKTGNLRCFWDLQAELYSRQCKPCQEADKATKGGQWEPTSRNRIVEDSSSSRSVCGGGQKGGMGGCRWVEGGRSTLWVPETIQRWLKKRQHFHEGRACFALTFLIYFVSISELYPEPWGQLRGHTSLFCSTKFWNWVDSFLKINSN